MSVDHHVAVLVFPLPSHAASILSLVRRLTAAAPSVKFSFFSTATSNSSTFSGLNFNNVKPYNVSDGIPEGYKLCGNPMEPIGFFMKAAPSNFKKAMEVAVAETGRDISCLITDAFFGFAGEMAEEMHVPWIAHWIASPFPLSAHIYTDLLRQKRGEIGDKRGWEDETIDFIPGLSVMHFRDLPEGVVIGDLNTPVSCMLHNMGRILPRATAVTINSFEEIDQTITNDLKSKLKKFINLGPFTLFSSPSSSDEHGCLAWLDKQKVASVAYISFGSLITPPLKELEALTEESGVEFLWPFRGELEALAEGLEESGVPFLWSFRGNPDEHLPKGFMERTRGKGKIVPWAPQLQVLEHASTGVFVTHCGWNSLTESFTGGVPMICRSFFADQGVNKRMLQDVLGIGVEVGNGVFTKTETMRSLKLVLSQDEGKKMRDKIRDLKELAMKAVGPNGSSVENLQTLLQVVTMSSSK